MSTFNQRAATERLRSVHPFPFYLEQRNDEGVEVRDNRGDTVCHVNFSKMQKELNESGISDESKDHIFRKMKIQAIKLAEWLVSMTNDE